MHLRAYRYLDCVTKQETIESQIFKANGINHIVAYAHWRHGAFG